MNTQFPLIKNINDVLPHIADKPEIMVRPGPFGSQTICYQFQDSKTFDNEFTAECRGIVFDREGNTAARPLHKFFNIGERPGTEPDLASAVRIMEKLDGSMVHTVWLDGQLHLKSKKCWDNAQTKMAWEWLRRPENEGALQLCTDSASLGYTVIFELTSPTNRIVVGYSDTDMRLLHVRRNVDGEYADTRRLQFLSNNYAVRLVNEGMSVTAALESLPGLTDAEGYVLQFENGDMVKAKCPWYLNLHRTLSFTRERDIAEAALEERLDDIKSALTTIGTDLAAVNAIEARVKATLVAALSRFSSVMLVESLGMDRKTFAIRYKGDPLFGLLMAAYTNREPDWKEWFRRNHLRQDYSLAPVGQAIDE